MVSGISMTVIAINITPRGISVMRDKADKTAQDQEQTRAQRLRRGTFANESDRHSRMSRDRVAGLSFVIGSFRHYAASRTAVAGDATASSTRSSASFPGTRLCRA